MYGFVVQIATVVFAVIALVMAVTCVFTGVAGLTGRMRRNRWFGVRTASTLSSDDAFTLANRVAGPGLIGAGVIAALGGVLGLALGDWVGLVLVAVGIVVAAILAGVVASMGVRAVAASAPAIDCGETGGCGSCSLAGLCSAEGAPAHRAATGH